MHSHNRARVLSRRRRSGQCGGLDGSGAGAVACDSAECPLYFLRHKRALEEGTARAQRDELQELADRGRFRLSSLGW